MSLLRSIFLCSLLVLVAPAWSHKASDAFLVVLQEQVSISVSLHDLDLALPSLDADSDRQLRWSEVQAAQNSIATLLADNVRLECNQLPLNLAWRLESLEKRTDATYVRFASPLACASTSGLNLQYTLLEKADASHRLVIGGEFNSGLVSAVNYGRTELRAASVSQLQPAAASGWAVLLKFIPEGVHHILGGPDHLAFLLALLLPIPLFVSGARGDTTWWPLLRTITGFTIGHSVTLLLANLGFLSPDLRWVEPAIAGSIAVSAGLNLYPVRWLRADVLALAFGLVHGMGFAGVMSQAQVSGRALYWGLAGFNVGVEIGQLAVLALWCALNALLARHMSPPLRELLVVRAGSCVLIVLACYWLLQRL